MKIRKLNQNNNLAKVVMPKDYNKLGSATANEEPDRSDKIDILIYSNLRSSIRASQVYGFNFLGTCAELGKRPCAWCYSLTTL